MTPAAEICAVETATGWQGRIVKGSFGMRGVRILVLSCGALALASCSDSDEHASAEDASVQPVGAGDAGSGDGGAPGAAPGAVADAGCSGTDAISQLLCQFGGGAGAAGGFGSIQDILNSF